MFKMTCPCLHYHYPQHENPIDLQLKYPARHPRDIFVRYPIDMDLRNIYQLDRHLQRIPVIQISKMTNDDINVRHVRNDSNINIILLNTVVYIQVKNRFNAQNVLNVLVILVSEMRKSMMS